MGWEGQDLQEPLLLPWGKARAVIAPINTTLFSYENQHSYTVWGLVRMVTSGSCRPLGCRKLRRFPSGTYARRLGRWPKLSNQQSSSFFGRRPLRGHWGPRALPDCISLSASAPWPPGRSFCQADPAELLAAARFSCVMQPSFRPRELLRIVAVTHASVCYPETGSCNHRTLTSA